ILGGLDFTGISIKVKETEFMIGNFIQAIIMFLLTALVIFSVMKVFNSFKRKEEEVVEEAPAPEIPQDIQLLTEIRDLLKDNK
ncbi:MAG: MscL family protein, partial [Eubacteriaceae bacterium]|nr:MscL family protein [Eubacteriaceae bacterium]